MQNDLIVEIINKTLVNDEIINKTLVNDEIPENLRHIIKKINNLSTEVFNELGTGFSEHIYHKSLEVALRNEDIKYESKRIIPINYKGVNVGYGESDIIVYYENEIVIVELKAVTNPPREIEVAQVKTYMKAIENSTIGLIINFPQPGTKIAKDTIDFKIVQKNT